jgi:hypothetical protein
VIERALAIFLIRRSMSAGLSVPCFGEPSVIRAQFDGQARSPGCCKAVGRKPEKHNCRLVNPRWSADRPGAWVAKPLWLGAGFRGGRVGRTS